MSAPTAYQRRPPLDSTPRQRSSRRAPALAWLVLPLLAALLATSAAAQTPQLLAGNSVATGSDVPSSIMFGANNDVGIVFRTGTHPTGYSVANVRIQFMGTPSATDLSRLTVTIRNVASANPGVMVIGTFTDPATGSEGDNTFTAPAGGIKLEPSTNYALMLDVPQNQGLAVPLSVRTGATRGDEEASIFGWTIRNNLRRRVSNRWESPEQVPFFQISGSENPPDAPAGLTATAGDTQVTLSWTDPSNSAIDKYQLRQGTGTTVSWGSWTDITSSSATTTSHTVTGLANGTQYSFQVRAVDGTVNSTASATVTATPVAQAQTVPVVEFSTAAASQVEGMGSGLHTISLSINPAPSGALTVPYTTSGTASRGTDYTATGSATVPANATTASFFTQINDDELVEGDETAIFTLTDGADYDLGSMTTYTLTIVDDDMAAPAAPAGLTATAGDTEVTLA